MLRLIPYLLGLLSTNFQPDEKKSPDYKVSVHPRKTSTVLLHIGFSSAVDTFYAALQYNNLVFQQIVVISPRLCLLAFLSTYALTTL